MEEEIERLRTMLGDQDIWQRLQESEDPKGPRVDHTTNVAICSGQDEDEDEILLPVEHGIGGRLKDIIGYNPVHDLPGYNLEVGQEAPEGELFCALEALNQYPYNYISSAGREKIVNEFFANGKIYDRAWDFFYIYPPASLSDKALILIPSTQVQHLLANINESRKTWLRLPSSATETGFVVGFPKDGTPRPRYLGHTKSSKMAQYLKVAVPSIAYKPNSEPNNHIEPTELSLREFKKKTELLLEQFKRKKDVIKEKKKTKRHALQREYVHVTKRVQRYLGLREGSCISPIEQNLKTQVSAKQIGTFKGTDVGSVVPFTQEFNVVFICIDVESYEKNHNTITEIGVATLDTADLTAVPPGENGEKWRKSIRARHIRVNGTAHLKNTEFVHGCPDDFQFGETEWVDLKDIPKKVADCLKYPYSTEEDLIFFNNIKSQQNRKIILVGHDVATDIDYLRKIGYEVSNLSNLHEVVDTTSMDRALQREANPRGLGTILASLDIAGWFLHNAGNDAVYTLQAMIGLAIQSLLQKENFSFHQQEREGRMAEYIKSATEIASERQEGWSTDGSDGGEAPLAAAKEKKVGDEKSAVGGEKIPDDKKAKRAGGEKKKKKKKRKVPANVHILVGDETASYEDGWASGPW